MTQKNELEHNDYNTILKNIIHEIHTAKSTVAKQINIATHNTYWKIGKLLFEKKLVNGYGSEIINRLSVDLKTEFPNMGLSPRNLWDMKKFYERYKGENQKLRQAVAVLPWGHNLLLLNKLKNTDEVLFYAEECYNQGWSRDLLLNILSLSILNIYNTIH